MSAPGPWLIRLILVTPQPSKFIMFTSCSIYIILHILPFVLGGHLPPHQPSTSATTSNTPPPGGVYPHNRWTTPDPRDLPEASQPASPPDLPIGSRVQSVQQERTVTERTENSASQGQENARKRPTAAAEMSRFEQFRLSKPKSPQTVLTKHMLIAEGPPLSKQPRLASPVKSERRDQCRFQTRPKSASPSMFSGNIFEKFTKEFVTKTEKDDGFAPPVLQKAVLDSNIRDVHDNPPLLVPEVDSDNSSEPPKTPGTPRTPRTPRTPEGLLKTPTRAPILISSTENSPSVDDLRSPAIQPDDFDDLEDDDGKLFFFVSVLTVTTEMIVTTENHTVELE